MYSRPLRRAVGLGAATLGGGAVAWCAADDDGSGSGNWMFPARVRVSALPSSSSSSGSCSGDGSSTTPAVPGSATNLLSAIGNTPLVELPSLSRATGCRILAKCEHLNPGGSIKDRAALWIIEQAEKDGALAPGGTVVEATGGNTGIGLALVAAAKGYKSIFTMPASVAQEKIDTMKNAGARVILTPGVPFSDARHYFHVAAKLAHHNEIQGYFFANQFENGANARAHFESTAPEIWQQAGPSGVDGFVCSAGTGGTIGGITAFLKRVNPGCQCWVVDPEGSGIGPYVASGGTNATLGPSPSSALTHYAGDKVVHYVARSPGSTITEGIGNDRITANFGAAMAAGLDGALLATDREAVEMAYHLLQKEGLCVGPSAALNVVGAVKLARKLGPGKTVVTVLCDGGERYRSKLWNAEWLRQKGLVPREHTPEVVEGALFVGL